MNGWMGLRMGMGMELTMLIEVSRGMSDDPQRVD